MQLASEGVVKLERRLSAASSTGKADAERSSQQDASLAIVDEGEEKDGGRGRTSLLRNVADIGPTVYDVNGLPYRTLNKVSPQQPSPELEGRTARKDEGMGLYWGNMSQLATALRNVCACVCVNLCLASHGMCMYVCVGARAKGCIGFDGMPQNRCMVIGFHAG